MRSCFEVLASASCMCSGTQAVVFQVCWVSLFSALAVTFPGKASFTGSWKIRAAQVGDRQIPDQGPFLGLTAKSRSSLASSASRGAQSQGHFSGKAILGPGPAADVTENLSSQLQLLTPCNQKMSFPFWSPRWPSAVAGCVLVLPWNSLPTGFQATYLPCWGVRGETIRAAPETSLSVHVSDEPGISLASSETPRQVRNRTSLW